ncbi:hypothetical protein F5Y07DRAFT_348442 [Xylaria sp. FL0933]|nr:hypothetical protein F5Y07DRAFT_348442 [Xylaria sp. FL0933]
MAGTSSVCWLLRFGYLRPTWSTAKDTRRLPQHRYRMPACLQVLLSSPVSVTDTSRRNRNPDKQATNICTAYFT